METRTAPVGDVPVVQRSKCTNAEKRKGERVREGRGEGEVGWEGEGRERERRKRREGERKSAKVAMYNSLVRATARTSFQTACSPA